MFNPDPSSKPVNPKLPRDVIMMIEKNNLVMAIKTLAADEDISMDDAKNRIDAYETQLKVKQQQNSTLSPASKAFLTMLLALIESKVLRMKLDS